MGRNFGRVSEGASAWHQLLTYRCNASQVKSVWSVCFWCKSGSGDRKTIVDNDSQRNCPWRRQGLDHLLKSSKWPLCVLILWVVTSKRLMDEKCISIFYQEKLFARISPSSSTSLLLPANCHVSVLAPLPCKTIYSLGYGTGSSRFSLLTTIRPHVSSKGNGSPQISLCWWGRKMQQGNFRDHCTPNSKFFNVLLASWLHGKGNREASTRAPGVTRPKRTDILIISNGALMR